MHQVSINAPLSRGVTVHHTALQRLMMLLPVTSATQIDDITPSASHVIIATAHMAKFELVLCLTAFLPIPGNQCR